MRKPFVYLSNQLGFSELLRKTTMEGFVIPRLESMGYTVLNPFVECAKYLDFDHLKTLKSYDEVRDFWRIFNRKVAPINNGLMFRSDCMAAILDGGHAVDDGVASEIGYYAGIFTRRPVFALRSDFRISENVEAPVNPQLMGYIEQNDGELFTGPGSVEKWFAALDKFYKSFC